MPPIIVVESLACALQSCIQHKRNHFHLHAHIRGAGLELHPLLANSVVFLLVKCGCMMLAQKVFNQLVNPNELSWNSLITGYVKHGDSSRALIMYAAMQKRRLDGLPQNCESLHIDGLRQKRTSLHLDGYSFLALLKACIEIKDLTMGCQIHQQIIENGLLEADVFLGSTLIDMYAKCGSIEKARYTFDKLQLRDAVTWTALMAGYVEHELGEEALDCMAQMQHAGVSPDAFAFSCSLKACGIVDAIIDKGQQLHAGLVKVGLEENPVISSTLIDMYAKSGFLEAALHVFDTLRIRNIVSWNALLTGFTERGYNEKSLECFQRLQNEHVSPDVVTFACGLKACGSSGSIINGQEMHILISKKGVDKERVVGNSLIDMYAKCGSLTTAQEVFDGLFVRSVVSWNALIGGYVEDGQGDEALKCFIQMQQSSVSPDPITFSYGLKACGHIGAKSGVQEIHGAMVQKGLEANLSSANTLVDMYMKCCMLVESQEVFDKLAARDTISWNVLISGCADHGHDEAALVCFEQMQLENLSFDAMTYSCCLKACGSLRATTKGQIIHAEALNRGLEGDLFVANSLLHMYVKCGLFAEAHALLDKLHVRTIVPWNALIKGYVDFELYEESLNCFELMQYEATSPDSVTYVCCLHACSKLGRTDKGRDLYIMITKKGIDKDVILGSTLVDMYSKWGLHTEAQRVFSKCLVRTVFSWGALITGYVDFGYAKEVLECLKQMQEEGVSPDDAIFSSGLKASASLGASDKGMELHVEIVQKGLEQDSIVGGTLVYMYGKCGLLSESQKVFEMLDVQTVVSWTTLIRGYIDHGYGQVALDCFEQIQQQSFSADNATLVCGLKACGRTGSTGKGQQICSQIVKRGLEKDLLVGNALVDMYAKCGLLLEAQGVFDELISCDESSWTTLITGYAELGESRSVFVAFDRMSRGGISPNLVTFLSVLNACTHSGLLDHGVVYIQHMKEYYNIIPMLEHCNCMVDIFARAGHLDEALMMVDTMPFHPTIVVWQTLLGACRNWRNVELGTHVFEQVEQLDKRDTAAYVCIFNIYADAYLQDSKNEF